MEILKFLKEEQINEIWQRFELPIYVYSESELKKAANNVLSFPNSFWLSVRYAMKANSNVNILKIFDKMWILIDASSEYEAIRALNAWIKAENIQLTSQRLPNNLSELLTRWINYNATSLHQLEEFGKAKLWWTLSIRINTWIGSWFSNKTNTWWSWASFGIWYEYIPEIKEIALKYKLQIQEIHTHLWVGTDPTLWLNALEKMLRFAEEDFDNVNRINMWWWLKLWRMAYEKSIDIEDVWNRAKELIESFYNKTWRKIHLVIEPWTYLVANCWSIICRIQDMCDTWKDWYRFIKLNTWMTEITRPSMYWAQHPIFVINNSKEKETYIVVGHCCESWDILTPELWDPEWLKERELNKANIWDIVVIDWTWAYCSAMCTKNYNSYPTAWEILIKENWEIVEIRKKEKVEDIWRNELVLFR